MPARPALNPAGQAGTRQARRRAGRSRQADPVRHSVGAARRRAHRQAPALGLRPVQVATGTCPRRAPSPSCNISIDEGRAAPAPRGGRVRRVPAAGAGRQRRGLSPQPPHRAEAHGAVGRDAWMSPPLFVLRPLQPADLPALPISGSRAGARRFRDRFRGAAAMAGGAAGGARPPRAPRSSSPCGRLTEAASGSSSLHPGNRLSRPARRRPGRMGLGARAGTARPCQGAHRPTGLELHVNLDNPRAVRFYEREGFVQIGEGVSPRSGLPILSLPLGGIAG